MSNTTAITNVRHTPFSFSRLASSSARVVFGILFFVMGMNGLVSFLPEPAAGALPAGAMALTLAFAKSGYLLPLIGATQAVVGALLVANRFVPLALTVIAP